MGLSSVAEIQYLLLIRQFQIVLGIDKVMPRQQVIGISA